ncbi:MAG: hypothetical protein QXI09_01655 [Candidatus Aenigmatarchaeota archaeon]
MNWGKNVEKAIQELKGISFWLERSFEEADKMVPFINEKLETFQQYLEPWRAEGESLDEAEKRMWKDIQERAVERRWARYIDELYYVGIATVRKKAEEGTISRVREALIERVPDNLSRYLPGWENLGYNVEEIANIRIRDKDSMVYRVIQNIVEETAKLAGKYLACEAAVGLLDLRVNYYRPMIELLSNGIIPRGVLREYGIPQHAWVLHADIPILLDGDKPVLACVDLGDREINHIHEWYEDCSQRESIKIDI